LQSLYLVFNIILKCDLVSTIDYNHKHGQSILLIQIRTTHWTCFFKKLQLRDWLKKYVSHNQGKIIVAASSQYVIILSLKSG